MRSSSEALLTIINDILDFSKIEAGKLTIQAFPFDLRSLIEEVAEMLAPRASEKRLDLVWWSSGQPAHALCGGIPTASARSSRICWETP